MFLLDSIALISNEQANAIVISGSHGGRSAAEFVLALSQRPSCVFFNDAGGGKDDARIGEAQDGYDNGLVSGINELAKALGIELNMPVDEAVKLMLL